MARKKQETLVLFPETEEITRKFTDAQFGVLMRAAFRYRFSGDAYSGDDPVVDLGFQVVASQIDRYEDYRAAIANNASGSKEEQSAAKPRKEEQSAAKPRKEEQSAAKPHKEEQSDPPIPIPSQSNPIPSRERADKPPAPAKPTRNSYGVYGWVKLSDDEFNRLLNDLGETEVKRCIAYVDEAAQTTGNKNKWRDWSLVVKKCHKQGWGLEQKAPRPPEGVKRTVDAEGNARWTTV